MREPAFEMLGGRKTSRLQSFLLSLGIHFLAVASLVAARDAGLLAAAQRPAEREALRHRKIVWYTRSVELPPVTPVEPGRRAVPPREFHPQQNIAASSPKPESSRQMILQSPPELRLERDIRSPNILAFHPQPVDVPQFRPKLMAPPREVVRPRPLSQIEAPQLTRTPAASPLPLEEPKPVAAPRFQVPERKAVAPTPRVIASQAPEIAMTPTPDDTVARAPKLPVAAPQFVVPEKRRTAPSKRVLAAEDPGLNLSAPGQAGPTVAALRSVAPVEAPRFVMQQRSSGAAAAPRVIAPADAPSISAAGGGPPQAVTAIVGLDPAPKAIEAPPGNRSAQFSAGPEPGVSGSPDSLPGSERADLRVPGLAIAPAARAPALPTITRPPLGTPDRATFRRQLLAAASISPRTASLRDLDSAPAPSADPVLQGATVYTMAIDMPNITSYDGSWTLRFTELGGSSPDDSLTAPIAMRKVDPKYIAAAAADGIQGKVLLYAVIRRDGRVDQVRLVQGIDERLDTSAVAAFGKWEFQPATKNGQPVDLEAVVQIPFRLGPKHK